MLKKVIVFCLTSIFLSSCMGLPLEKEVQKFFNKPLLNELGEEIQVNDFMPKSTKDFKIVACGITPKSLTDIEFMFAFIIKNKNMKIEYVKVQSVIPNDVLTFVDETLKNKNPNPNVKVKSFRVIIDKENIWKADVSKMPNILYSTETMERYLVKFTIKPVGKPEVIIYQPCMLPVLIYNEKAKK